jgi:hydrogenase maturation protease
VHLLRDSFPRRHRRPVLSSRVVLIGVGNPWRGDDGVGRAVVDVAAGRLKPDVEVVEADGEPSRLIDAWTDVDLAVVVDAVRSGAEPGTIHVWRDNSELAHSAPSTGSHALGVADAIALGGALRRLPRTLVVVGVEVGETSAGHGLAAAVAAKLDDAAHTVCRIVDDWLATESIAQAGSKATSSPGLNE